MAKKKARTKTKTVPADPPTVAEVRAIRAQMLKEAGGNIRTLLDMAAREARQGRAPKRARSKSTRGKAA